MNRFYTILYSLSGLTFLLFLSPILSAQDRCGTVQYEQMIHPLNLKLNREVQFEQWMQEKLSNNNLKTFGTQRTEVMSYLIPVVVHVIHNGESVGTGTNISDAQIASQIQVMNDDYKRLNADASNTPTEFLPVAGSIDITFVLAKQDPEGLATNGITRTKGSKTSWTLADNSEFKALSYWPAENYLNIWVIDFSSASGLIGYSQLPTSTILPGLEDSSDDRLTDGVAIDYQAFGSGASFNLTAAFNKGRTATHEVGHFLGLRHIWGDGNCATDYVADTPAQTNQTEGTCPSVNSPSCETNPDQPYKIHKMFQNYMDYTNDVCMNLFTKNQNDRMVTILAYSPRRLSLLSSPGASDPVPVPNDLGIRSIIAPLTSSCSFPITPQIEIRNYGNNNITSAQIQMSVNGVAQTPVPFTLSLSPLQSTTVSFNQISFAANSSQPVSFQILQTNGGTDGKASDNTASVQVTVPSTTTLPIIEPFNSLPSSWQVINPDAFLTWANVIAPDNNATNRAMYLNFHDYESVGVLDWLLTPSFTISNAATSQLKFDLAYAQYPNENVDELKIYALPGCSQDLSTAILLYDKTASALATAPSNQNSFTPTSNAQWRKPEVVALNTLNTGTSWQLAFIGKNGYGNNLYVDNVVVSDQVIYDVALTSIVSPSLVHCVKAPTVQFMIKNLGTEVITSFQVDRILNGAAVVSQSFSGISVGLGEEKQFQINAITLQAGANDVTLTITNPNSFTDANVANNTKTFRTYLDQSTDISPLRLTFDNSSETPWIIAQQAGAKSWEFVNTTKSKSLVYKAYSNTTISEESWVVSPVLDLSRYSTNSFFFDLSYAQRTPIEDRLKVLASTDCGLTYKLVLMDQPGSEFKNTTSSAEWVPTVSTDWKTQFISLDTVSGKENIRLAIVATNEHGNNIYIDNLQIFQGDDPRPIVLDQPYSLYYSTRNSQSDLALSFNLPEKKDVRLQIYSVVGQVISDKTLPETLNQTYYFDFGLQSAGIYLFRLQIDDQVSTTKVFIGH
jgi:Pregnancy-associated plasma protein-A/CARDB